MAKSPKKLKVTMPGLRNMSVGESRIFTERETAKVGVQITSLTHDIGIKVTTERCYIILPKTVITIKAVLVTRIR